MHSSITAKFYWVQHRHVLLATILIQCCVSIKYNKTRCRDSFAYKIQQLFCSPPFFCSRFFIVPVMTTIKSLKFVAFAQTQHFFGLVSIILVPFTPSTLCIAWHTCKRMTVIYGIQDPHMFHSLHKWVCKCCVLNKDLRVRLLLRLISEAKWMQPHLTMFFCGWQNRTRVAEKTP